MQGPLPVSIEDMQMPRTVWSARWMPAALGFCMGLSACGGVPGDTVADKSEGSRLKSFGFVAIDCNFDDPRDPQGPRDYVDEVASFTNTAHVCVSDRPDDDVRSRLARLRVEGMRALLQVEGVLFTRVVDATAPGGLRAALRTDAAARWQNFITLNAEVLNSEHVATIYIIDEPYFHRLPGEELEAATNLIASTHPEIPRSFVESWTSLDQMRVPSGVDWIGFNDYTIRDPSSDPRYLGSFAKLKAARSRPDQGIIIIMDAQWRPSYLSWRIFPADMAEVAANYLKLAQAEPDVVAIIGYVWPGGLDTVTQSGARDLPENVQQEYRRIGSIITGK